MRKTEAYNTRQSGSLRFLYNTYAGRIILKPLITKPVSFAAGFLLDRKISSLAVKRFIRKNNIDMSDYENRKFRSFNDFFTRKLTEGARSIDPSSDVLISPCDARLSVFPIDGRTFNIKGVEYTLSSLLENDNLANFFNDGYCLIFRLAVDNYHRYCWCTDGPFSPAVHIKGKYHTVQPIALSRYKVFRENVREYTVIDSPKFGKIVQMEVGALNVGRICNYDKGGGNAEKGKEKGKFEFGGSTVILLINKNAGIIDEELISNTENGLESIVKYGETILK